MLFRVLGPVEATIDEQPLPVGSALQRRLLAALLLNANRVVDTDHLIEVLWGAWPPATARAGLQGRISHLRRVLAPAGRDRVPFRSPGYLLRVEPGELDLAEFERLSCQGRQALSEGNTSAAATALHAALELWRGPALHGIDGFTAEVAGLAERRLAVLEDRIHADLALGRHTGLVAELEELVAAEPLRERPHAHLMLALYRQGRQADALTVFATLRRLLVTELGVEPGPALQQLHQRVLAADPALLPPEPGTDLIGLPAWGNDSATRNGGHSTPPAQLPPPTGDLIGREPERSALRARLLGAGDTMTVCALYGPAGSGKTAIAIEVAHEVRGSFPGGVLYVRLPDVTGRAAGTEVGEELSGFIRALGHDTVRLPGAVAERSALFRSLVAGRRVLVVIDNACSESQVRPLLPSQPGCAVVVTSRAPLSGLDGAIQLHVEVLDETSAVRMLGRLAGDDRVAAEPDAARRIAGLCGWLPLALRIAGARLAARPAWPLRVLADRLSDRYRRLDELTVGDLGVRASIERSYRSLNERDRRGFRLLGAHGMPDLTAWLSARLLGETDGLLERLVDAQLLEFAGVDTAGELHYRFHDLVRLFAEERAAAEESGQESGRDSGEESDEELRWPVVERVLEHVAAALTRTGPAGGDWARPRGMCRPYSSVGVEPIRRGAGLPATRPDEVPGPRQPS